MPPFRTNSILIEPDPLLRKKAGDIAVSEITKSTIQHLIKKMAGILMGAENGVGLAAPQIGVSKRIFIVLKPSYITEEKSNKENNKEKIDPIEKITVYINPVIINHSRKNMLIQEGCLSVPNMFGNTKRFEQVTLKAFNEKGKKFQRGASGILSQIIQHEIDHLNGVLFLDIATNLKKYEKT